MALPIVNCEMEFLSDFLVDVDMWPGFCIIPSPRAMGKRS